VSKSEGVLPPGIKSSWSARRARGSVLATKRIFTEIIIPVSFKNYRPMVRTIKNIRFSLT